MSGLQFSIIHLPRLMILKHCNMFERPFFISCDEFGQYFNNLFPSRFDRLLGMSVNSTGKVKNGLFILCAKNFLNNLND